MKHLGTALLSCLLLCGFASAQTEGILYNFTGQSDGSIPVAGLTADSVGALYGAAAVGGTFNFGVIFKLTPPAGGKWTESVLYTFADGEDGGRPESNLIFDSNGNIYGTTTQGGANGCGTFFKLAAPDWTESTLYDFPCGPLYNGAHLSWPGNIVMNATTGTIYGIVLSGGLFGGGWVYQFAPNGDSWDYSVIYNFNKNQNSPGYANGCLPRNLILEGNALFGINGSCGRLFDGSIGSGTVFRLTPAIGAKWNFTLLYSFNSDYNNIDGYGPYGLLLGSNGVLYGGTFAGGVGMLGTIYSLTPPTVQGQPWTHSTIHAFTGAQDGDGGFPLSGVVKGPAGVLYGTTSAGGFTDKLCGVASGCGTIFELSETDGTWTETILHYFNLGGADGNNPSAGPPIVRGGNLYGLTTYGGVDNVGAAYVFHP